jgi:hypothetical protein
MSLAVAALVLFAAGIAYPAVLNVPSAAYPTIQSAIDAAADGDEVEIAEGEYVESINFNGKAITVRSTDPADPDVVANTMITTGRWGTVVTFTSGEDLTSVLTGLTIAGGDAVLGDGSGGNGGGIRCDGASPTISLNIIRDNRARSCGGGIALIDSRAKLEANQIVNNVADVGAGVYCSNCRKSGLRVLTVQECVIDGNVSALDGGGLYVIETDVVFRGTTINGNSAGEDGGGVCADAASNATTEDSTTVSENNAEGDGGGACSKGGSSWTFNDTEFRDNKAGGDGGGFWGSLANMSWCKVTGNEAKNGAGLFGAGRLWWLDPPILSDVEISGNQCTALDGRGGGLYFMMVDGFGGSGLVIKLNKAARGGAVYVYRSKGTLRNGVAYGNETTGNGSAFHIDQMLIATGPFLVNWSIFGNTAGGVGAIYGRDCDPLVIDTIVAHNTGGGVASESNTVYPWLEFCDVWGNSGGNFFNMPDPTGTWGNFSDDPLFIAPDQGDCHLKSLWGRYDPATGEWVKDDAQSSCIDAGDPAADFSNETEPNGGRVNMGAYGNTAEASKSPPSADLNEDGIVDEKDLVAFMEVFKIWQKEGVGPTYCDIDGDGNIDIVDADLYVGMWQAQHQP